MSSKIKLDLYNFLHVFITFDYIQVHEKMIPYKFSLCHWNLDSTVAHNFSKLSQLKAYKKVKRGVSLLSFS